MDDETGIRQAIEHYFQGLYHSDVDRLERAFHPNAWIVGLDEGVLKEMTLRQFLAFASAQPAAGKAGESFDMEILQIQVDGDIASARVADTYIGRRFIDHLALVRLDGEWRIYNKLWHVERSVDGDARD